MNELDQALGPVSSAVVTATTRITDPKLPEVRRIRLRIDDPSFRFTVGQIVGVVVLGPHPFGNAHHMRRYTIADGNANVAEESVEIELLVRRCFSIDEVSGEQEPGIASNFLCDARPGDTVTLTGPYRNPFRIPADPRANVLMIGAGTGVQPFRTFVKSLYAKHDAWQGEVRLFYGARSGMDLLYLNNEQDDLGEYYDRDTFKAFRAVLSRPLSTEADALESAVESHADEIWALLQDERTHVYLAGLEDAVARFDAVMERAATSMGTWHETRAALRGAGRWSELTYS